MSKARELAELGAVYDSGALSNRNMIVNGAMVLNQRGNSTGKTSGGYYGPDRSRMDISGGTWSIAQNTTAPTSNGFTKSFSLSCTATNTPSSSEYLIYQHKLEGQNLQHLGYGTSSAKKTTLSFWVRSNKTGTYKVNWFNTDNSRQNGRTYTIDAANTWEHKTITIDGDTSQSYTNDNGDSLYLEWWLSAGTSFTSGSVPTAWQATSNADRGAGLNVNLADSTNNEWYITGIQYEVGDSATPFEHRSFGDELARCQRYFYDCANAAGGGSEEHIISGAMYDANYIYGKIEFPVTMRTMPSLVQTSASQYFQVYCAGASNAIDSLTMLGSGNSNENFAMMRNTQAVSFTAGQAANLQKKNASASVAFDAEL